MIARDIDTNKAGEALRQNDQYLDESEGISLKDLVLSIWGYRRAISVLTLAATLLIGGIGAGIYLFQQKQHITRLQFSLDFDGVEKNEYPNGTKFSTSDILVSPIINNVYDINDLKRYLDLAEFRSALSVIQTNDNVRLLEYEYAPKLDDKKLTIEQRSRLEAEFLEKKKSLLVPIFNLILSGNRSVLSIPPTLRVKVLQDILSGWAEYADRVKGASKFQIPLVSKNILRKEDLDVQDYLVAVDMLRTTTERVMSDITKLQKIPGAANFRLQGNDVSLQDLKYRLQDMEKFKISPLLGIIRLGGITKSDEVTKIYLQHRIFELKMKEEDATSREKIYEDSFNNYSQGTRSALAGVDSGGRLQPIAPASPLTANVPSTINQLGETFLSSIIKMAQENLDAKFRQELTQNVIKEALGKVEIVSDLKYYERLFFELSKTEKLKSSSIVADQVRSVVLATVDQVYDTLQRSIDVINALYEGLSKANLNPASTLFTVKEPALMSEEKSLTLVKVFSSVVMICLLVVGCILIGVLIFHSFRRRGAPQLP
ncbi:MAG: hypothetical protein NTU74_18580 [Deltaproteobacteria bacterium]|nr:hypothetical protein [Deltaproteobacteria bacterium]